MRFPTNLSQVHFKEAVSFYDGSNQQLVNRSVHRKNHFKITLDGGWVKIVHEMNEKHPTWVPVSNVADMEAYDHEAKDFLAQEPKK